ncbi:MAG: hypothetical protein PHF33_10245 [Candidatus Delongbacteria bacterium]|nr:hypothetical protein [Candidatus Delongbacteria bacterium]
MSNKITAVIFTAILIVFPMSLSANTCLDFDGVNDYVQTTLDVQPSAIPVTTWEAWVKPSRLNYSL